MEKRDYKKEDGQEELEEGVDDSHLGFAEGNMASKVSPVFFSSIDLSTIYSNNTS
jgi:hypothetical protein